MFLSTQFTLLTWYLKSGNTTQQIIRLRSDTMVKLRRFHSVIGSLNVQFKSFMTGMIHLKMKTIRRPAESATLMFKFTFRSLRPSSSLFCALFWLFWLVVSKKRCTMMPKLQTHKNQRTHPKPVLQIQWSKIHCLLNKKK